MPHRWQSAGQDREPVARLDPALQPRRVIIHVHEAEAHLPADLESPEAQADAMVTVAIAHHARQAPGQPPGVRLDRSLLRLEVLAEALDPAQFGTEFAGRKAVLEGMTLPSGCGHVDQYAPRPVVRLATRRYSRPMGHDAELDAILEQVEAAGLVEQYLDEEGQQAMRLTPDGVRVARQLAMVGEDGQDELMAALLEAGEAEG